MTNRTNRHRTALSNGACRRGAVSVELALTVGLAFFFFFASFEFSRVAMIRGTVDNAIYEGARAGVIPGATVADVENKTREILKSSLIRNASVTVTPNPLLSRDATVTVRVDVALDRNTFSPSMFFGGKLVSRSFTMKREASKHADNFNL
jgi:Flp pilus assembly protein TadG